MTSKNLILLFATVMLLFGCAAESDADSNSCGYLAKRFFEGDRLERVYFPLHRNNSWTYIDSNWSENDFAFLSTDTSKVTIKDILNHLSSVDNQLVNLNEPNPLSIKSWLLTPDYLFERVLDFNPDIEYCFTFNPMFANVKNRVKLLGGDGISINTLYEEKYKPLDIAAGNFAKYLVHIADSGKSEYAFRNDIGFLQEKQFIYTATGDKKLIRKVTLLKAELF